MAIKKRGKAKKPDKLSPGRKKELKRFVLEMWTGEGASDDVLAKNETAFVVRTSGGERLNTTDTKKLLRLIQHELRALGHKLVRKGQELDPKPREKPQKAPEPPANEQEMPAESAPSDPVEHDANPGAEAAQVAEPSPTFGFADGEKAAPSADPDDPTTDANPTTYTT